MYIIRRPAIISCVIRSSIRRTPIPPAPAFIFSATILVIIIPVPIISYLSKIPFKLLAAILFLFLPATPFATVSPTLKEDKEFKILIKLIKIPEYIRRKLPSFRANNSKN